VTDIFEQINTEMSARWETKAYGKPYTAKRADGVKVLQVFESGGMCPYQCEGSLSDGRFFYGHLRHGTFTVFTGPTRSEAVGWDDSLADLWMDQLDGPDGAMLDQEFHYLTELHLGWDWDTVVQRPDSCLAFLSALNARGFTYKMLFESYLYDDEEAPDINLAYVPDDPDGNVWEASWVYEEPIGLHPTAEEAADAMWVQYMIRLAEQGHDQLGWCRRLRGRKRQKWSRALRKTLAEVRRLS
jgi:hypothetical protein